MIWQNGWAALGLIAVAVPVLIHLLSRRRARPLKFPTLRFIDVSRLMPTRRTRLSDVLLLAVRAGIVLAAVAGLAQPLFLTADRRADLGRTLARAIIIDTSASMLRATPGGETALAVARREAQRLAAEATTYVTLPTVAPGRAFDGGAAWLATQPGRRELVIVSDFQSGVLDDALVRAVPPEVGLQLVRVDVAATTGPLELRMPGDSTITGTLTLTPDRTAVDWSARSSSPDTARLSLLAGARERPRAMAALHAAHRVAPLGPWTSDLAIVFPQYDQRAAVLRSAQSLDQPWMAAAAEHLRVNPLLVAAAARAEVQPDIVPAGFTVLARNDRGMPVAFAAHGSVDGRERLLVFSLADAGSLASAALIAAATSALTIPLAAAELDPSTIAPAQLVQWQRPIGTEGATADRGHQGPSDGRWFWMLALLLLAVEAWMRRASLAARAVEVVA